MPNADDCRNSFYSKKKTENENGLSLNWAYNK